MDTKPEAMTEAHAPTPWYLSADGYRIIRNGNKIAEFISRKDAAATLLAVNSHARLLKAAANFEKFLADIEADFYSQDQDRAEWPSTLRGRVAAERATLLTLKD